MTEESSDGTEVIDPTPADAQSVPEQDPTPDPDSVDAAKSTEPSQDDPKEPSRAEKRIQQLVGDRNHALEFGKLQQERATDLQRQLDVRSTPETPAAPVMPTLEAFDYDQDAWAVAVQSHNQAIIKQTVDSQITEALQQNSQTVAAARVEADWQSRVKTFTEDHADFIDVASNPATLISPEMAVVIKALENGPELAYHLGQNPAEADRINSLPSSLQAFELGKLDLSSKPTVAQKQVTGAPDPMSPVGGGQPVLSTANETMNDFMARRNAEEAETRKTRGMGRV